MRSDTSRRSRSWLARLALVLGALVVLTVAAAVAVSLAGRSALEAEVESWAAEGRDLERFLLERPVRTRPNDSALELERLAAALGIDIVPKSAARERPAPVQRRRPGRGRAWEPGQSVEPGMAFDDSAEWLREVLASEDAAIPEPPATFRAFVDDRASALEAVKEHLLGSATPLWEQGLNEGFEAPIPNLLGHLRLARLLLADALMAAHDGRHADAEAALAASWGVSNALEERDSLISHVILVGIARMQAGVARHLPELAADEWGARFAARRLHDRLARAVQAEAVTTLEGFRSGGLLDGDEKIVERVTTEVFGARAMAFVLELHRALVRAVEGADCAALDFAAETRVVEPPRWNPVAAVLAPRVFAPVNRSALADFHSELTARVLQARAAGGSVSDDWALSRCEGVGYEITPTDAGGYRVSFTSDLPRTVQDSVGLPAGSVQALSHVEP